MKEVFLDKNNIIDCVIVGDCNKHITNESVIGGIMATGDKPGKGHSIIIDIRGDVEVSEEDGFVIIKRK